jgi:anti-anti-sigma factor
MDSYRRVMQGTELEIQTRVEDGRWLVEVRGEIDLSTVGTLEAELHRLSGRDVVLDLGHVDFIDSTGVALLFRTAGRLTVGAVSSAVERVLRLCGVELDLRYSSQFPRRVEALEAGGLTE